MQLTITTVDPDAVRSLRDWLHRAPELRGSSIKAVPVRPTEGQMGSLADAVQVISDNGTIIAALAATVGTWLTTRHRVTKIRVRNGDREVEIETGQMKNAQEIAAQIISALEERPETEHGEE